MVVDLSKKYKTVSGCEVKLYEIVSWYVNGSYYSVSADRWIPCSWNLLDGIKLDGLSTGKSPLNLVEEIKFKPFGNIKSLCYKTKQVDYFGIHFDISSDVNYIATDECGEVWGFIDRPTLDDRYWTAGDYDSNALQIATINFEGDWKESLMEVKYL